ncbi:MAG: long-chain acyl-CoA synthetase [Labilithrix sp.]|nr:long-chain acyl-CoA synthetase [Labilithrix sp.]
MIADALRADIETFAKTKCRENLLFRMAEEGNIDAPCIRAYLTNLHYLLRHTPICLVRARKLAISRGDHALAEHFKHKLVEEAGHFRWAEDDLASLPAALDATPGVLRSMERHVQYIIDRIDENPSLFLAYILFGEYFTVVIGPEWLRLLDERCGIPRTSMTVIDKHIEIDQGHVEEALDNIDDLVAEPKLLPRMRAVLRDSMDNFYAFCTELAESHGRVSQPSIRQVVVQAPAA